METEVESLTKYGERHRVSKTAATKWRDRGNLVMAGDLVDVAASDARMKSMGKGPFATKQRGRNRQRQPPATGNQNAPATGNQGADLVAGLPVADETPAEAAERIIATGGASMTLVEAERVKENYLALLRQLEYDQKAGVVVMVADATAKVGELLSGVRSNLRAIPSSIAPRLVHIKDPAIMQATLQDHIDDALRALCEDRPFSPAVEDQRQADEQPQPEAPGQARLQRGRREPKASAGQGA